MPVLGSSILHHHQSFFPYSWESWNLSNCLADVLNFKVEDIRGKDIKSMIWHLSGWEREECLHKHIAFQNMFMLIGEYFSRIKSLRGQDVQNSQEFRGWCRAAAVWDGRVCQAALRHAKILIISRHISPRRETPSCPPTPAPSRPCYTPTPLFHDRYSPTVLEEDLLREREAYKALVQDGSQPSHPIELEFKGLR